MLFLDSASKYAVKALTDALRNELSSFNIKVSSIQPGRCKTHFSANALSSSVLHAKQHPLADSLYPSFVKRYDERMKDEQKDHYGSFTAHDVAVLLEKVLVERAPQTENVIGMEQAMLFGVSLLPQEIQDIAAKKAASS